MKSLLNAVLEIIRNQNQFQVFYFKKKHLGITNL